MSDIVFPQKSWITELKILKITSSPPLSLKNTESMNMQILLNSSWTQAVSFKRPLSVSVTWRWSLRITLHKLQTGYWTMIRARSDVTKSCLYIRMLNLRWAQRNFAYSADEYKKQPSVSNSACQSFCIVKLKRPSDVTINFKNHHSEQHTKMLKPK